MQGCHRAAVDGAPGCGLEAGAGGWTLSVPAGRRGREPESDSKPLLSPRPRALDKHSFAGQDPEADHQRAVQRHGGQCCPPGRPRGVGPRCSARLPGALHPPACGSSPRASQPQSSSYPPPPAPRTPALPPSFLGICRPVCPWEVQAAVTDVGVERVWLQLLFPPQADDSNDMWEDEEEDQEDEEEGGGLAGQLLSDILATSKYGERPAHPHPPPPTPGGACGLGACLTPPPPTSCA